MFNIEILGRKYRYTETDYGHGPLSSLEIEFLRRGEWFPVRNYNTRLYIFHKHVGDEKKAAEAFEYVKRNRA